jgi:hypothetical protein
MTRAGQAGIPGERRARKIEGQFIPRLVEMLESHAYRVLSLSAHRCLSRIEIEHANHGGKENGQLAVTYDQFVEFGLDRHAIGPALRELEALGFVKVTQRGVAGNADHRAPNRFRLTYLPAGREKPTHEWRRIKSVDEAKSIATAARNNAGVRPRKYRVQKQKPVGVSDNYQCGIPTPESPKRGTNRAQSPVGVSNTTYILSGGARHTTRRAPRADGASARPSSLASQSPRSGKRRWSKPGLVELFPGPRTISLLASMYREQAERNGEPDDVWAPPLSPVARLERERANFVDRAG